MNTVLGILLFAAVVLVAFFLIRRSIKWQFPNLGRIASALILIGGTVLDQLNALPWGQILTDAEAKAVGFTIAVGMMMLHAYDLLKAQINPPPPPPPAA